jgi:hypothetical protein
MLNQINETNHEKTTISTGEPACSPPQWEREKPYAYGMTGGGLVCIFRNGEKIAQIMAHGKYGFEDAAFKVSAMNARHNWLKNKTN